LCNTLTPTPPPPPPPQVCTDPGSGAPVLRRYLHDGDTVVLRGHCQGPGYRVGFGSCSGQLLGAK
jgi:hypothetical protein